MPVAVRSFGKINIGLAIGSPRDDGFHELRTVYQTIALHDVIKIEVQRGSGIEIRSKSAAVPCDESNTCHRVAERVLKLLKARGHVIIQIEKHLPVQGGLGGASSNGVATLLGLERELKEQIPSEDKLRIAAEVGSDLPLFLIGGTALGIGRGEQVFPLQDLPALDCVVATPAVAVSTPEAFAAWDALQDREAEKWPEKGGRKLTSEGGSDRINEFSRSVFGWLSGTNSQQARAPAGGRISGVLRGIGRGDRAEALLLDLVRAGIENDFERVVFPEHPELREVKRVLERHEARYVSMSGSGSAVYGLFDSHQQAERAAAVLNEQGTRAQAIKTLGRDEYWKQVFK
jgi:4-diphosphocytidyl-2-C-methyl-D-erythritol kinase